MEKVWKLFKKIAIFISGRGSNMTAILEDIKNGIIDCEAIVISDNKAAVGLSKARQFGIKTNLIIHNSKEQFARDAISLLDTENVDYIILAGFMHILSANLINRYKDKILNIHPALLPSFKGLNARKQAVDAGVKIAGCTVHFATNDLDGGPIIIQAAVPVKSDDTPDSLAARILKKEHIIYPKAISLLISDRLEIKGKKVFIKKDDIDENQCMIVPEVVQ